MNQSVTKALLCVCMMIGGCGTPPSRTVKAASHPMIEDPISTEGMWLPGALPMERLKRQFDFVPTSAWIENLRLASVRIGASGAFVSPDGLVLTNHHVAVGGIQNISGPGKDYVAHGFLAKTREQEIQIPGQSLSVLVSIEDVTARVNAGVDPKLPPEQAAKARRAVFADIERESQEQTGLQSDVVTLYGGALFHLYRYKRYSDVRIVFAPEAAVGFFGGDPDNFEYPRYDLDVALLRAYENGKPARVEHYLKISTHGVADGELIFVSGHPGHTDRLLPVSVLEGMRETMALRIENLEAMERTLIEYGQRSAEARRQAQEDLFGVQNSLKATRPRLAALRQGVLEQKRKEEESLRSQLRQRDDLRSFDAAWDRLAAAEKEYLRLNLRHTMLERGSAFGSSLFHYAREIDRLAAEDAKPDPERLPEYTQARRQRLEQSLFADDPIYLELEIAKLSTSLQFLRDKLGADDSLVKKVLTGQSPAARAGELVSGSKLGSVTERRRLRQGGAGEVAASSDTMIRLARLIDEDAREVRQQIEAMVFEPQTQALSEINRARFALFGTDTYPDATGTLRLAYGVVKGYEQDGRRIPPWTTFGGAFEHERQHGGVEPFALPESWAGARDRLDPRTPLDFVCTADITGGNSGSPIVNRAGELVGVIFDSNRQGVAIDFAYSDVQARAVAVDCRAIWEALSKIYGADALVAELTGK